MRFSTAFPTLFPHTRNKDSYTDLLRVLVVFVIFFGRINSLRDSNNGALWHRSPVLRQHYVRDLWLLR